MVSIITNCYNGEKYLEETIQSVLNQTYADWEYLLFDNNSTDRSAEIFLSYNDSRFKYYKNEFTVPLGHGRHDALELVSGDYICFIDSDDLWLPDNLAKQVEIMEQDENIGIVYTDYFPFGKDNYFRKTSDIGYRSLSDVLYFYDLGLSSTMFRRSVMLNNNIKINKEYNLIADFDLFIRLIRVSKCYHIKEFLVKYRTHDSNLTKISMSGEFEYQSVYNAFLNDFSKDELKSCKKGFSKIKDNIWEHRFNKYLSNKQYWSAAQCLFHIRNIKAVLVRIRILVKKVF